MKVAGFTIIRNAEKFDYPVAEAILSVLALCEKFYVGLGKSDDGTRKLLESIPSDKLVIVESEWDETIREGGQLLSVETNKIFDQIPEEYDWCFYVQADECAHEDELKMIKEKMLLYKDDPAVDGLLFEYKHFYGHYDYIGVGRRWYRHEIRVIRNNKNIRSYKDAQGFRKKDGSKLRVKNSGAIIYHYGWVKSPKAQQTKQENFHKMWHDDEWMKKNIPAVKEYDYNNIDLLASYYGPHPLVMEKRLKEADWKFVYDRTKVKTNWQYNLLYWIEKKTGYRIAENKNYKLI